MPLKAVSEDDTIFCELGYASSDVYLYRLGAAITEAVFVLE